MHANYCYSLILRSPICLTAVVFNGTYLCFCVTVVTTKSGRNALDLQMRKARGREASDVKLGTHELVPPCCEK